MRFRHALLCVILFVSVPAAADINDPGPSAPGARAAE